MSSSRTLAPLLLCFVFAACGDGSTAPPAMDLSGADELQQATDAGAPDLAVGPDMAAPPRCTALGTILGCDGDNRVECTQAGFVQAYQCSPPGFVCREAVGTALCVSPHARPCNGFSARCEAGEALNCTTGTPWEYGQICPAGRECAISSKSGLAWCAQPGAHECDGNSFSCYPMTCADGELADCCAGFVEKRACSTNGDVCVVSTRQDPTTFGYRACLPPDYTSCDPATFQASCTNGSAINCYNYVSTEACVAPNDTCTVSNGQAGCVHSASNCGPAGWRGRGCAGPDDMFGFKHYELVCSNDPATRGLWLALPCPTGCTCYSGTCESNSGETCDIGGGYSLTPFP